MLTSLGFSWATALFGVLNLFVGGVLVALINSRPGLKQAANDHEKIVNEREANLLAERASEMDQMRERIAKMEERQDQKDAIHEAERTVDRHRINNLSQCLDMLLALIEQDPAKAADAAGRIKEMRARQMDAEAKEKAVIQAATIVASAKSNHEPPEGVEP